MIHTAIDAAILLLLTFGGLLQTFDVWAARWFDNEILRGTAFIGVFMVFSALTDLPFQLLPHVHIEARFGFNKMTRAMWIAICSSPRRWERFRLPLVLAVSG
jgi:STE24 endopeptidase